MCRNIVPYPAACPQIHDGDLLLWQARRPAALAIAGGDRSIYSHVGRVSLGSDGDLYSLEFLQWRGPVVHPLREYARDYPERIDVYRPDTDRFPEYDPAFAADEMLKLMQRFSDQYGWRNIGRVGLAWVPGGRCLWHLWAPWLRDNGDFPPHCADSTARCDIKAGVDPVPGTPNWATTPADFGRSLLYKYRFSLGEAA